MQRAGADMLHLDIMDGHFVPNITFGAPVAASLRGAVTVPFDVHLMISEPLRYIDDFAGAGADIITFHAESDSDIRQTVDRIRSHGIKAGLSVKPETPVDIVYPFLDGLAMVLVMTVEPGFGGQKFLDGMCSKLRALRGEITRRGLGVDIQVDGGIDETTAPIAAGSGANVLVAGSSLFGRADYRAAVEALRAAAQSRKA